jgi:hypothetical protein
VSESDVSVFVTLVRGSVSFYLPTPLRKIEGKDKEKEREKATEIK